MKALVECTLVSRGMNSGKLVEASDKQRGGEYGKD